VFSAFSESVNESTIIPADFRYWVNRNEIDESSSISIIVIALEIAPLSLIESFLVDKIGFLVVYFSIDGRSRYTG